MQRKAKFAQISIEYLIIVGFVTFVVIGILGVAFFYTGNVKDKIKITQMSNFANKILSTSESVFYYGEPSKATITCYLPDNVKEIEIIDNDLIFTFQTTSGTNKISFSSNVPISEGSGSLTTSSGLKKIQITAEGNEAIINQV